MYKILSFDVGIKNLAYCLIHFNNGKYEIKKWGIINLIEESTNQECCEKEKCKKPVKWLSEKDGNVVYYCGIHKGLYSDLDENWEDDYVSKTDKLECSTCGKTAYYITKEGTNLCAIHKKSYLKKVETSHKLKAVSKKKCNNFTTFDLGKKMFNIMDGMKDFLQVDEVLIENQPTLKNPRMKAISSLAFSYFILRGITDGEKNGSSIKNVRFISPSNKLKVNQDQTLEVLSKTEEGKVYKMTKDLAKQYTRILLKDDKKWLDHLDTYKKKDDMCDALLQGYHYLYTKIDTTKKVEKKKPTKKSAETKVDEKVLKVIT